MKKLTLLLIFLLATASLFAQAKPVAYIIGAETQTTDTTPPVWVETILVQLNADMVDPTLSWTPAQWDLVLGDFKILDGTTLVPVIAAEVNAQGNNFISLSFDYTNPQFQFGPDKNDLKLNYVNYSGIPIVTEDGNLQNTTTAINIDDGIAPIIIADTLSTNNANPFLGEAGDVITFAFEANEALATNPVAPQVVFTLPQSGAKAVIDTVTATIGGDNKHWSAVYTVPDPTPNLDGKVSVTASFWDVHANQGTLPATDTGTDGSFVIVKNYDPAIAYVDSSWHRQADVDPYDLWWQWDAFAVIQDGVDGVTDDGTGTVNVHAGTYEEQVVVNKDITLQSTNGTATTIIQPAAGIGVESVSGADGFTLGGSSGHGFTIQSGTATTRLVQVTNLLNNVTISYNTLNTTGNASMGINVGAAGTSGLTIDHNTFTAKAGDGSIWADKLGSNATISNNTFSSSDNTSGYAIEFMGATGTSTISGNTFNYYQYGIGILAGAGGTSGLGITGNTFDDCMQGIMMHNYLGGVSITTLNITGNIFTQTFKVVGVIGIVINDGASVSPGDFTITGNDFSGCDIGVQNNHTTEVNAEDNWWGSGSGPNHVDNTYTNLAGDPHGVAVSDYVDYVPWNDTSMSGSSFWPVELTTSVKASGYFSSFNTAIDAASGGETITAKDGTFTEYVIVDKAVTINSINGALSTTVEAPTDSLAAFHVTASNVTLGGSGFTIVSGGRAGIYADVTGGDNITVQDNIFKSYGDGESRGMWFEKLWNGAGIKHNSFTTPRVGTGIMVVNADGATIDSNTVATGTVKYCFLTFKAEAFYPERNLATPYAEYVAENPSIINNLDIVGNSVTGMEAGRVAIGFAASTKTSDHGEPQAQDLTIDPDGVTISENIFSSNGYGIGIDADEPAPDDPPQVAHIFGVENISVNANDFTGNTIAVYNGQLTTLDAENNWWNSENGPTHHGNTFNVTAQGDSVTDYVDYVPWLDDEFSVGDPFAPVWLDGAVSKGNMISEHNKPGSSPKNKAYTYYSSIQAAIDVFVEGGAGNIFLQTGTFTEDFDLNKDDLWLWSYTYTATDVILVGQQTVSADEVAILEVTFDPDGAGTALTADTSVDPINVYFRIYDCIFTINESPSVGIYLGGGTTPHKLSNVVIQGCIFNGPDDKNCNPFKVGGWFGTNIGCEIDGLDFYNNEVNKGSIPINLVNENINDVLIRFNDFYDTDGAMYFWNSPASSPTGVLTNFVFRNNYIPSTNSYGLAIGGASLGGPTFTDANFGTGNTINYNAFEMSGTTYGYGAVYMADQYTGLLDASSNWWGDQYGPLNDNNTYTPPATKGRATVSDRVEFAPWYNDGTDAEPGRGWEPDAGTTLFAPVMNVNQETYHSSIQRAVDGATAGDTISCLAGTFDECVTIDKNLHLHGASASKGTTYLAPSFVHMDSATVKYITDLPVLNNTPFQSVLLVDYAGTDLTVIHDFIIDGSIFSTSTPASGGYFAGIFFDDCAGTVTNITLNDIYTAAAKGVGIVVEDDSGTDKTTEVEDCAFNTCPTGALWFVYPNAMGNIHDNTIDASRNSIMFLSSSSTTASIVDNNTLTNCQRGVIAYPFNADVKIDITDNTFDFSGTALATSVDAILGNSSAVTYSFELDIDNNDFIGNYPPGSKVANDSKPINFIQNCTGTSITNNTFDNFYRGIFLNGGTVTNLEIKNNVFTDIALNVISIEAGMVGVETMAINYNSFDTNSAYAIWSVHATSVNAQKNWYGDATGPDDDGDLNPHTTPLGAKVSEHVTFIPWYATSTVTPSTEYVRTHQSAPKVLLALAYADAIQPCIDAAAGDYYYVCVTDAATPYTENLAVDHKAYIYGQEPDKATPPVKIIGTHEVTADSVTFDDFIIDPNGGIAFTVNSSASTIDNTTFQNCTFDLTTGHPIGILLGGYTTPDTVSNVTIDNNTFNGPTDKIANPWKIGGYYGTPVSCPVNGVDFTNNTVDKCSTPINLQNADINDIFVDTNVFTNTDGVLYVWGSNPATGKLSNFVFTKNTVDNTNSYGIGIGGAAVGSPGYTDANFGVGNYINDNSFDITGTTYGFGAVSLLSPVTNYILDAESNWWGSANGPTHSGNTFNVGSQGSVVSDHVDYVRWYSDAGMTTLFAPVVDDGSKTIVGYYSSIQAAIDAASSGDDITCYNIPDSVATFTEDFSVNTPHLTLRSDNGRDSTKIQLKTETTGISIEGGADNFVLGGYVVKNGTGNGNGFTILSGTGTGHMITLENNPHPVEISYCDLDLTGNTAQGITCGAASLESLTLDHCEFNSTEAGETMVYGENIHNSTISNCDFIGAGPLTSTGTGVMIWGCPDMTYTGNTFEGLGTGLSIWSNSLIGNISNNTIQSNTFYNCTRGIWFGEGSANKVDITTMAITQCIFHSLGTGIQIDNSTYIKASQFNIWKSTFSDCSYGCNNVYSTKSAETADADSCWWGATDGPSFTFDYGIGSGSGVEVTRYVDYSPWYTDSLCTILYTPTVSQYLIQINPTSPYQNNYFDIRIAAADTNGTRNQDYGNLADFSSNHVALSVPEEQLLVDGFKEVTNGCISTEAFAASDHLTIYSWEYNTNPPSYYSSLTDIVIQAEAAPAPPTNVAVSDVPNDNGGWIYLDYTMSVDDPFYIGVKNAGVSYYIVERDSSGAAGTGNWQYFTTIGCYDDGSGTNTRRAILNAPASDETFAYRMASVNNPSKDYNFGDDHISYEPIPMGKGASQSAWADCGSAAAADNLPAYADFTVYLEGPYNVTNNNMNALNSFIPLSSPYDGETVTSLPAGTVDWLQIQLRTTATGATEKTANAFLLSDGSIVDVDGNHSLPFYYTTGIDYYIVISHRNHLDIMTSTAKAFGDESSSPETINLSIAGSVYGNGFKEVETGVYAMYAGDANDNGQVQNNDLYDYWSNQVGTAGYLEADFNLNGQVQNDDRYDFWKYNVGHGSSVPGGAKNSGDNGNSSQGENTSGEKSVGITFTFANGVLSGGYFEFDVMAAGSAEGKKLGSNQTYINYSTAGFGENVVLNNKVTVEKGTLLQGDLGGADLYRIENIADNTTSRFAVTVTYDFSMLPTYGNDLTTTATQLLHVKIEIADPYQTAGLSFEQSFMADQQYESDNTTKYSPVVATDIDNSTLPVELSAFTAVYNVENEDVIVKWTTQSETDVQGFNIYRSECDDISTVGNHINYSLISLPETGTSTNPIDYSYEDIVAYGNTAYYYWLEAVDYGGTSSYHGPIVYTPGDITGDNTLNVYDATKLIGANPNPAHNYTTIKYQLSGSVLEQNATIRVYNILGKCVKTVEGRNGTAEFDVSDLGSGIYLYQLKTSNYSVVKKLSVIK